MRVIETTIDERHRIRENADTMGWVIIVEKQHQYGEGVTAVNKSTTAYVQSDLTGFPYAAAAYKAFKDSGIKLENRKGDANGVGQVITQRVAIKFSEYMESHILPDKIYRLVEKNHA